MDSLIAAGSGCRGRDGDYSPPPAQIPACGFPAPGSCRRSNVIGVQDCGVPYSSDPQARDADGVLCPARCPEHALPPAFHPTGLLPSPLSASALRGLVRALRRYYGPVRLLTCSPTASSPRLPVAAQDRLGDCGPNEVSQVPTNSLPT